MSATLQETRAHVGDTRSVARYEIQGGRVRGSSPVSRDPVTPRGYSGVGSAVGTGSRSRGGPSTPTNERNLPGRLLILLISLLAAFLLLGGTGAASGPSITIEHRVRAGDTLWDLGRTITAPGDDVRETVELIRDMNGLTESGLRPGQILVLPAG